MVLGWKGSFWTVILFRADQSATSLAGTDSVRGLRVLLVDDLWETGSTLRRVAEVLGQNGAIEIRALVMTRTK